LTRRGGEGAHQKNERIVNAMHQQRLGLGMFADTVLVLLDVFTWRGGSDLFWDNESKIEEM